MDAVRRTDHRFDPDPHRVVARPFLPGMTNFVGEAGRIERICERVSDLSPRERDELLAGAAARAEGQFEDIEAKWLAHWRLAGSSTPKIASIADPNLRLLIGAYLTQPYAYEGAALTNPSMVPLGHPEADGSQRFVMSARAIGEGHISSIAFFTGIADASGRIVFDERYPYSGNGSRRPTRYRRSSFHGKLSGMHFLDEAAKKILSLLPEEFDMNDLEEAFRRASETDLDPLLLADAIKRVRWVAASNYEVDFDPSLPISEHLISPAAPAESHGMEDARFVRFSEEDGAVTYYATYTAYDGLRILPQLIQTQDFHTFRMATITGPTAHHKGMALFPRRIQGEYVALSRHDHETTFIMRSDDIRTWDNAEALLRPELGWEAVQNGNCGSPIETDQGWLVITHGVGPMRRYVLGAILLDLDEPTKVIARSMSPILEPEDDEAVGYVPGVLYSCGSMLHGRSVIIPYGFSDRGIGVAIADLGELISQMS